MRLPRKMQNKRTNIADIDAQKTHASGPDGTYGDLGHKTFREAGAGPMDLGLRALPRQHPPNQRKQHCQRKVNAAEVQVAMA